MRWTVPLLFTLVVLITSAGADETKVTPPPASPPASASADTSRTPGISLPAGAIVVVSDTVAEALKLMPKGVWLTPERFQQLIEAEAKNKKLAEKPRVRIPSKCAIKGKIDGPMAVLQATFEFDTDHPGTLVRLGCGQAHPTSIRLNGKTPALVNDPTRQTAGFAVEVDKPGDHQLTLDLLVPVVARPGGQGLTLDLPRAAITTIDLSLPASYRDVRLNGKTLAEARATHHSGRLECDSLGAAERLELGWRTTGATAVRASLAAAGVVNVRVDSRQVTTEANLTLRVLGGQTKSWSLLVPFGAEVVVDAADAPKVAKIETNNEKVHQRRVITLKEQNSEPLHVTVKTSARTPQPGSGTSVAIGPFNVAETVDQTGVILVSNTVADLHLDFTPHGDLRRRALSPDEARKDPAPSASFAYGPSSGPVTGWLDLETDSVRGQMQHKSTTTLRLADDGDPGPAWLIETELVVTPRWADVDRFLVQLPQGCDFVPEGSFPLSERLKTVRFDPATRQVEFRLNRATEAMAPFKVRLICRVPTDLDLTRDGMSRLPLPRPVGIVEPDSVVRVVAPSRVRLIPADNPSGLELLRQATRELVYRCSRRPPDFVTVGWGPYRAAVEVTTVADIALGVGNVARVRQEFEFRFPEGPRPRQRLDVPSSVYATLAVRTGEARLEGRALWFTPPGRLVLEYDAPANGDELVVPLVTPESAGRVETKARLWADGGRMPAKLPAGWVEGSVEEVPGRQRLPFVVLRSSRLERSLRLDLSSEEPTSRVLIERALARVTLSMGGTQDYRVRYRLAHLAGSSIDLEFPAPVAALGFQAKVDGKIADPILNMAERPELRARVVRLKLSGDLVHPATILEVAYQCSSERSSTSPLSTTLFLPRVRDEVASFPTRWQVVTPSRWLVFGPESPAAPSQVWTRRGWLLTPVWSVSIADHERWLDAGANSPDTLPDAGHEVGLSAVVWRETDAPLVLISVSRSWWLLGCSVLVVLLGILGIRLFMRSVESRRLLGVPVSCFGALGIVLLVMFWPGLAMALAYGMQPGLAVLLVLVPVAWFYDERRRIGALTHPTSLANFSRSPSSGAVSKRSSGDGVGKRGSSVLSVSSSASGELPQGLTVDEPISRGSDLERQGSDK